MSEPPAIKKRASSGVLNLFSLIEDRQNLIHRSPSVQKKSTPFQLFQREKELLGFYLTGHPMDGFKKKFGPPLLRSISKWRTWNDGAIVPRCLCDRDRSAAKVSSKSQKKFAILTISDGMERFELPIWPEMYEEKGHLLVDNQLLIAVLQVDKKEEALKLQCKWIGDLTNFDEKACKRCL